MPFSLLIKNIFSFLVLFLIVISLTSCIPKDDGAYYPSGNSNYSPSESSNYSPSENFTEKRVERDESFRQDSGIKNSANMHKYTMRKYCVQDKCYTPSIIKIGSRHSGVASWYGEKFHGKKTSNGETYNMYGISAAHKTFPMNTIVRVRNISNNKTVTLRVNDRGPFVDDRIIDLSFGAAKKIGSDKKGLTEVELEVLGFNGQIDSPLSFKSTPKENSYEPQREYIQKDLALQLGSFSSKENAMNLAKKYEDEYYKVAVHTFEDEQRVLYRVRVLGFKSLEEIEDYKDKYNLTHAITVGIK